MNKTKIIEAEKVSKFYIDGNHKNYILKDCTFSIEHGKFISIIGRSGLGKTTLLKVISGIDKVNSGLIKIDDTLLTNYVEDELVELRRNKIGYVFQNYHLISSLSVLDNILLPVYFNKSKDMKVAEKEAEALMVDLQLSTSMLSRRISELSGGEMQRVAMARALINKPKLIMADEPTGNLDSKTEKKILDVFKDINNKYNTTIVVVTHSNYVADFTDQKYTIGEGVVRLCE